MRVRLLIAVAALSVHTVTADAHHSIAGMYDQSRRVTLDGVIASEGGIPLMSGGKIIGAIGCSGALGSQDGQACKVGADTIK